MRVNEIFHSIQGEGILTGVPMVFIRLQGCNLRCSWCDTTYAQDGNGGELMTPVQVANTIKQLVSYNKRWLCITGGEPLLHTEELWELIHALKRTGIYNIEVETNGSFPPPHWFPLVDSWVADIKCPSSGTCGVSKIDMWFSMRRKDQIKFVVGNEEDLDFVRETLKARLCVPHVLVSPVMPNFEDVYKKFDIRSLRVDESILVPDDDLLPILQHGQWLQRVAEFCKDVNARYSLQIHKVIWGNKKGV